MVDGHWYNVGTVWCIPDILLNSASQTIASEGRKKGGERMEIRMQIKRSESYSGKEPTVTGR